MRLIQFADGTYQESSELLKMFGLESRRNPIISVVGAGGKTSLIKALADEYTKDHRSVIVTTTTHMMQPEFSMFPMSQFTEPQEQNILPTSQFTEQQEQKMLSADQTSEQQEQKIFLTDQTPDWRQQMNCRDRQQIWLGIPTDEGKIKTPSEEMWEAAFARRIPVLIEADGAKRKPCKAPAEHEPVIRPETTAVIGVLGMDAIGGKISEVCHRPELVADLLGTDEQHRLTGMDFVQIAVNERGLHKAVDKRARYIIVFQKTNKETQNRTACEMAHRLNELGYQDVFFGIKE